MVAEIDFTSDEFINLCKTHQVKELYLFGSQFKGTATVDSDVDLLVEVEELDPLKRGGLLLSLYVKLEDYFGKKIDLITPDSIKNVFFEEYIDQKKKLIYAA